MISRSAVDISWPQSLCCGVVSLAFGIAIVAPHGSRNDWGEDFISLLIFLVSAFVGIAFLYVSFQDFRAWLVLRRGGPKTLSQYLRLFPAACRQCGYRELTELDWFDRFSGDSGRYWICNRCYCATGKISWEAYPNGFNRDARKAAVESGEGVHVTVVSPYITEDEASSIPDFGRSRYEEP